MSLVGGEGTSGVHKSGCGSHDGGRAIGRVEEVTLRRSRRGLGSDPIVATEPTKMCRGGSAQIAKEGS